MPSGFLGRSIKTAAHEIAAYADTAGKRRRYPGTDNGKQAGDPDKAVAVILKAVDADSPPLHLPLGPLAHAIAKKSPPRFARTSTGGALSRSRPILTPRSTRHDHHVCDLCGRRTHRL